MSAARTATAGNTRSHGREGMTREELGGYADTLLDAAWRFASPSGSLITLPGAPGGYGTAVDGLEGFARTFLAAGFRLAGERGSDPGNLAERYARGLAAGTDPSHHERWVTPVESAQAKVEAASIALILDMTRPWIWDRLDPRAQEQVVDYLSVVVGDDTYPRINWVWFRVVVETFLRSVGGPWSAADLEADLAAHDSFLRAEGWYSDGEERAYDHYAGWALHLYPVLWARMSGASEADGLVPGPGPEPISRRRRDIAHLDRYLRDAVRLIGADGGPLIQGRSLTYRFAAAGPFWAGALAEVPGTSPGRLRQAATRIVGHFLDHGVPGPDGLLTLGWHHEWRPIAQSYSGTGSPYWAAKGLLGLALPADHPAWTAEAEPLPVDHEDHVGVLPAPGWAVSATAGDGVVRVINHGTDHARPGDLSGDSPLYARLGYSTATAPLLDAGAWERPADQSVVLLDEAGRATHRTGFRTLRAGIVSAAGPGPASGTSPRPAGDAATTSAPGGSHRHGDAAVLASVADARWLEAGPAGPDHGSGVSGAVTPAGTVTTVSVVRGPWEVRLVRVDALHRRDDGVPPARAVEISGWAVSGHRAVRSGTGDATANGLRSRVVPLSGPLLPGVRTATGATPLGAEAAVPFAHGMLDEAAAGTWLAVAIGLGRVGGAAIAAEPSVDFPGSGPDVAVHWHDGVRTAVVLPAPGGASGAA
ncbi:DUF2264 domain-containing protein [Myceligenerans crystallogenes]|uniref:DUF2264 domain-containing protein n=1 Tax=Myceligenerans crystallogenes TaxID=316335 RepID=A0ABP4ZFJ3_9MICO